MNIDVRDPMEIFVDGDSIILKKYSPTCIFCGSGDGLVDYKGKKICNHCMNALSGRF